MDDCIFCKIISGAIHCEKKYEDADFIIFKDIQPKARLHYLAVPKSHFALIEHADKAQEASLGRILKKIADLKEELGLNNGYRLTINQGRDAGQTVFHLHIHIMGGQELDFPDFTIAAEAARFK